MIYQGLLAFQRKIIYILCANYIQVAKPILAPIGIFCLFSWLI